jgi:pyruvate dehydrogenase E1 component beta subunit
MEPIRLYRSAREVLPSRIEPVPLGSARVRQAGDDVTVIAWGAMLPVALEAAAAVQQDGITADVIDLRSLSPIDWATISPSVERTGRLVVVHEAPRTGGPGAEVVATLVERCFYALRAPPRRVCGDDIVYPPQLLEDTYLPHRERVAAALRLAMED